MNNKESKNCIKGVTKDITNQVFDTLVAERYAGNKYWICKCNVCGAEKRVQGYLLRNGRFTRCNHGISKQQIDLTNKTFGEWKVLRYIKEMSKWECQCSCGKIRYLSAYNLTHNSTKSCGHSTTGYNDLTNMTFGEWTVLHRENGEYSGSIPWLCRCSCGTEKIVSSYALRTGLSTSCGCKKNEKRIQEYNNKYEFIQPEQIGTSRTQEQINYVSSKENMVKLLNSTDKKLKTQELANILGLDRASTMIYLHKYKIENMVEIEYQNSMYEDEIAELFPTEHKRVRGLAGNKEIDLYYPDKKIGIEFNRNYWHSELKKDKLYHFNKTKEAAKNGIRIIHIFEYEWLDKERKRKLINLIKSALDIKDYEVIHGRKCSISEVSDKECKDFLNKYHLQGYSPSKINIGLFNDNNEMLGIMTFGKPRFENSVEYELIRLAWNPKYRVIGGSNKLFKYFISNYNPSSIISYCDISKFNGKVYNDLGFKLIGISSPNYRWCSLNNNSISLTRYQAQKSKLLSLGYGTKIQTESEIMHSIGYIKVYDCGNARFMWEQ